MFAQRFLYFLCLISFVQAASSDQFEMALKAQKDKQYQVAFDLYCAIPTKTFNIMFNMGAIAYHEGNYPKAIAFWRKACSFNTIFDGYLGIDRIFCVIKHVKNEQLVPTEWAGHPADDPRFYYHIPFLWAWYAQIIPLWIFQLMTILLSLTTAILILISLRESAFRWRYFYIIVLLLVTASITMHIIKVRTYSYAVIKEECEMRYGPGDFFESIGSLYPLVELLVETRALSWCKVRYQDKVGWIPEKTLYFIDDYTSCGVHIVNRSDDH